MTHRRILPTISLLTLPVLGLAGCSSTGADAAGDVDSGGGAAFSVVTSTTVYADLAQRVVGDSADVEPVIDSAATDPHDYEATARDGLAVNDADLVIMNGGGYDSFMAELIEASGVEHVIQAVEFNHDFPGAEGHDDHDHGEGDGHDHDGHDRGDDGHAEEDGHDHDHDHDHAEGDGHDHGDEEARDHDHGDDDGHGHIHGFNEHVWYDPHTMAHFIEGLRDEMTELLPDSADQFAAGADDALADIEALEASLDDIAAEHSGETVFFTEPVGGYFAAAAGLTDVTVDGFAEAVEHGESVAPAILNDALKAIEAGEVTVLVANAQTGGAETDRMIEAAEDAGVPVVEFTETIPDGSDYMSWMTANAEALAAALG